MEKRTMLRKCSTGVLISLVVIAGLMFNVNLVSAGVVQDVHVMVAYDEEFYHTARWVYWCSPETLCHLFVADLSWKFKNAFNIKFTVIRFVVWMSDDSITDDIDAFEREVIADTGFYTGMIYNTIPIDVLIAFSDQTIVDKEGHRLGGKANYTLGTAIVIEEYDLRSCTQYTDNILQHEVTHLYADWLTQNLSLGSHHWIKPEHWGYDCVMNMYPVDNGRMPYGLTTENWCDTCKSRIMTMRSKWGREEREISSGCPTLFTWDGNNYVDYGVIDIHNSSGEDVIREVPILAEDVSISNHEAVFRLREGWEDLKFSESFIDQVKLYAIDEDGKRKLCPLLSAEHSRLGDVRKLIMSSDDVKVQTLLLETIDLTFKTSEHIKGRGFVFVIEGYNYEKEY